MVSLIALVSSGKGSWAQVTSLIQNGNWDKTYLICNQYSFSNYNTIKNKTVKIKFNEKKVIEDFEKISIFLKKQIKDFEVAVNISSGTGIEHMALITAILKSGLGLRFVYSENKKINEFNILNQNFLTTNNNEEKKY